MADTVADEKRSAVAGGDRPDDPRAATSSRAHLGRVLLLPHLTALDQPIRTAVGAPSSPGLDRLAAAGEWLGDWESSLPFLVAGTALVGGLTDGGGGLLEGGALLAGVLTGSMVNEGLNQMIGRERPGADEGAYAFDPLEGHAAFPSGHTAYAFSIAGGIDAVTDGWIPAAAAYGAATVTGASRVYHEKHWFTDVVVGAAVGAMVSLHTTRQLVRWIEGERATSDEAAPGAGTRPQSGPSLTLRASPGFLGVGLRF